MFAVKHLLNERVSKRGDHKGNEEGDGHIEENKEHESSKPSQDHINEINFRRLLDRCYQMGTSSEGIPDSFNDKFNSVCSINISSNSPIYSTSISYKIA